MMYEDRKYQIDCAEALFRCVTEMPEKNPVVAVPTGAGKTIIMGLFLRMYLNKYPDDQIVVLSHVQEILEQNYTALSNFFPDQEIGLYSSGLNSRSVNQITVAGIQSAYRQPKKFRFTNLYLVDEVHTVSAKSEGMYRTLLDRSNAIKTGMSATCFRTGHGFIYEHNKLFNYLAYDLTSMQAFNKLVTDGYLTKLYSVAPQMEMNIKNLKRSGGDFQLKDMSLRFDNEAITDEAITETIKYGDKYKKWLIFAIDIDHANHIHDGLISRGIASDVLHSRMDKDRKETINSFKNGKTRALVSVGMVTTGFDAPNVDLIVLLRPTMSSVLHVQMIGRGLRTVPGKDHCLVLDFAGNTVRLGPINDVLIPRQKGEGKGEAPTKMCPNCRALCHLSAKNCSACNFEFTFQSRLSTQASTDAIVRTEKEPVTKWLNVTHVQYARHTKVGKPDSVIVIYHCGLTRIKEWLHPDHTGYVQRMAWHWAEYRGFVGTPDVTSLLRASSALKVPKRIEVDYSSRYPDIINYEF